MTEHVYYIECVLENDINVQNHAACLSSFQHWDGSGILFIREEKNLPPASQAPFLENYFVCWQPLNSQPAAIAYHLTSAKTTRTAVDSIRKNRAENCSKTTLKICY